jgi:amidohydrolase
VKSGVMENMYNKAREIHDEIVDFRRDLHRHPEVSGQEFRTQQKIIEELEKMGVEYKKAGRTSVIAFIRGNNPGKTVMLRGDIDALPVKEESDVEFKSEEDGKMHACGHDFHTSMLLGALKILNQYKDDLNGEIRFFFQEAEETFEGAKNIIKEGFLDGVDVCLGIHDHPLLEVGKATIKRGELTAGCDTIYVHFEGMSGHGSTPHLAKDTIHPACVFVENLQAIVTKNTDAQQAIVLSVGKFSGGTKANIIAKNTDLDISMRYFNPKTRLIVHDAIKRHAKAIADMFEIKVDIDIVQSAPSVYNDEEIAEVVSGAWAKVAGEGNEEPMEHYADTPKLMGSEDFSYYLEQVKGVMVWLGGGNKEIGAVYPHHHEKFKLDENMIDYGVALYSQFTLDYLEM